MAHKFLQHDIDLMLHMLLDLFLCMFQPDMCRFAYIHYYHYMKLYQLYPFANIALQHKLRFYSLLLTDNNHYHHSMYYNLDPLYQYNHRNHYQCHLHILNHELALQKPLDEYHHLLDRSHCSSQNIHLRLHQFHTQLYKY